MDQCTSHVLVMMMPFVAIPWEASTVLAHQASVVMDSTTVLVHLTTLTLSVS